MFPEPAFTAILSVGFTCDELIDQNSDLWKIRRYFGSVTFFFFTDSQVKESKARGLFPVYKKEYLKLVKVHDEFGYLNKGCIYVGFDSKENFDTNYRGNWFYYDR